MPRRKTLMIIRKYLIVCFATLLVFIWLNYDRVKAKPDDGQAHFPHGSMTPTTKRISMNFMQRQHHLRKLVPKFPNNFNFKATETGSSASEEQETTSAEIYTFRNEVKNEIKPSRYFVKSEKCKMPYVDPFSQEVLEIYTPFKLKLCCNETDIFELNYDWNKKMYVLHLKSEAFYKLSSSSRIACNFQGLNQSSDTVTRTYFRESFELPKELSGIIVECHDAKNSSRIVQQDAFPLVQVQDETTAVQLDYSKRQPSVILLGLDSISRMNFQRTMPRTAKFVNQMGWFEMEGYNKVGDNTVQNLLPILMGSMESQMPRKCFMNDEKCLQKIPWIWRDYRRAGYTVALAEDLTSTGVVFVDDLVGYHAGKVDHNLHPLLQRMEKVMSTYKRFGYNYCIGRRLTISYVYDFCRQFIARYVEELERPSFGYFWSSTFTHDHNFGAASLDDIFVSYMEKFKAHQLFDKAIVILFSDHGARFGDLMNLSDSFLEERLPMLHIYLPPWFRTTYPKFVQALYLNKNRLSSNFDLHNTLRHILQLNATKPVDLPALANCPSSQSLLHPLPRDRSCEQACIGDHWCTCKEFISHSLNGDIFYMAKMIVFHINRWMLVHKFNTFCQRLHLLDVDTAEKKLLFEENGKETMHGVIATYRLRFRTLPDVGKFQATVRFNRELKKFDNIYVPDISRLNSYHNHSLCVDDVFARKFCFCYPKDKLNAFMENWQKTKLTTLPG